MDPLALIEDVGFDEAAEWIATEVVHTTHHTEGNA